MFVPFHLLKTYIRNPSLFSISFFTLPPIGKGNISSGNQPLHVNYGNINLNHTILIQGRTHERWEGRFAKFMEVGGMICKGAFANYSSQLL
jgi:hypothetical protein